MKLSQKQNSNNNKEGEEVGEERKHKENGFMYIGQMFSTVWIFAFHSKNDLIIQGMVNKR